MEQNSTIDNAVETVEDLVEFVVEEMNDPIFNNSIRNIADGDRPSADVRSEGDMDAAISGVTQFWYETYGDEVELQAWYGKLQEAQEAVEDAFGEWKRSQNRSLPDSGPYSAENTVQTGVLLNRLEAVVLSIQRAMAGATRTHQETFYNPHHDEEVKKSFQQGVWEADKWLYWAGD